MPVNKDFLTRIKAIDNRLRRYPRPTLKDLINACSEEVGKRVSKRSVQLDIQEMRYNQALELAAPIVYNRFKRTYQYSDSNYNLIDKLFKTSDMYLKLRIEVVDDDKPALGDVELAGAEAIRDLSAYTLLQGIGQFALTSTERLHQLASRDLVNQGITQPSEQQYETAMRNIKLRDLQVKFDESFIPKQPKS